MKDQLKIDLLEVLVKHNVLPDTFLRNEIIRQKYDDLRTRGIKSKEARENLADEYFTSVKTIETIIYAKEAS